MNPIDKKIYYRLIALWAVCEGMLGGIIHGFNLPLTGLTVGSSAVIIICLIAYYVPGKGNILRATIIVAIFKMMLSPHSPLPAYFAVFFQGITGELFFFNRKFYKVSCIVFAAIALTESGVQRIITMTILYGTDFWKAVNTFISGLSHQETITNYSLYLAGGYVLLHVAAGIFIGIIAGDIPAKVKGWSSEFKLNQIADESAFRTGESKPADQSTGTVKNIHGNRKKWKRGLLFFWIFLLLLFIQSEFKIGTPLLSPDLILYFIVRSFVIILTWYFLISPVITFLLKKWLKKQQAKSQGTINEILLLLPSAQLLLERSWQNSAGERGLQRLSKFLKTVLVNSLDMGGEKN